MLDESQLVLLAEVVRESYDTVEELASDLNESQEALASEDLSTWEDIRDAHTIIKGGKDGVDVNNERKRQAIYYRLRNMLGLSSRSYDADVSGSLIIQHTAAW